MRVLVQVPGPITPTDFPAIRQYCEEAERIGLDGVNHPAGPSGRLDPLPVLAAIAAVTSRIQLMHSAPVAAVHAPTLAHHVASLDVVSGGRAMVWLGIGAPTFDYTSYALPRVEVTDRTRLEETGPRM
jgi:alkanesulfonate monooxygenase SsuD/methylene tetrahydromethanopterin reductase-like flavin-dependent oxidoreductase (luciferase family)